MPEIQWGLCPVCRNKTRLKIRGDTILINFPLYCPKCKQETLITAQNLNITIVKEPDAQTQSRRFPFEKLDLRGGGKVALFKDTAVSEEVSPCPFCFFATPMIFTS